MLNWKTFKIQLVIIVFALFVGLWTGYVIVDIGSSFTNRANDIPPAELVTVTEVIADEASQRELNKLVKENAELHKRLKELKAKPAIVIREEVFIEGAQQTLDHIPSNFLFRYDNGLTIAGFETSNETFKAEIYDLKINHKIVVSKGKGKNTFVHTETKVQTAYDNTEVIIIGEPEALVIKEKPKLRFEPRVSLRLASDLNGELELNSAAMAGVSVGSVWLGGGLDVSNTQGPRPAVQLELKF